MSESTLYITSGDIVGRHLSAAGLDGDILVWHDVLYDGSRCPGWPDAAAMAGRVEFLYQVTGGGLSRDRLRAAVRGQYERLAAAGMSPGRGSWNAMEILLLALVAGTGAMVGAQFALGARALALSGRPPAAAAAAANAADLLGAAAGSLLAGLLFMPLLGPAAACVLLFSIKAASLVCLLALRPDYAFELPRRRFAG